MDDLRSALMQIISGRTAGGDPSAHLKGLLLARLKQRPEGDPLRGLLGSLLAQQQPGAPRPQVDPHALLRAARDALGVLQARNAVLASALGACSECWGTEQTCSSCSGLGRPGWAAPDEAAFATWVAPAISANCKFTPADQAPNGGALP